MMRYRGQSASQVEAVARRYAASTEADAPGLVLAIGARASLAARTWATRSSIDRLSAEFGLAVPAPSTPDWYGGHDDRSPASDWVRARLGGGRPLPDTMRTAMEEGFGVSLADVRLHNDDVASTLANRVGAPAFTVGEHVAVDRSAGAARGRSAQ